MNFQEKNDTPQQKSGKKVIRSLFVALKNMSTVKEIFVLFLLIG